MMVGASKTVIPPTCSGREWQLYSVEVAESAQQDACCQSWWLSPDKPGRSRPGQSAAASGPIAAVGHQHESFGSKRPQIEAIAGYSGDIEPPGRRRKWVEAKRRHGAVIPEQLKDRSVHEAAEAGGGIPPVLPGGNFASGLVGARLEAGLRAIQRGLPGASLDDQLQALLLREGEVQPGLAVARRDGQRELELRRNAGRAGRADSKGAGAQRFEAVGRGAFDEAGAARANAAGQGEHARPVLLDGPGGVAAFLHPAPGERADRALVHGRYGVQVQAVVVRRDHRLGGEVHAVTARRDQRHQPVVAHHAAPRADDQDEVAIGVHDHLGTLPHLSGVEGADALARHAGERAGWRPGLEVRGGVEPGLGVAGHGAGAHHHGPAAGGPPHIGIAEGMHVGGRRLRDDVARHAETGAPVVGPRQQWQLVGMVEELSRIEGPHDAAVDDGVAGVDAVAVRAARDGGDGRTMMRPTRQVGAGDVAPDDRRRGVGGVAVLEIEMVGPVDQAGAVGVVDPSARRPDVEFRKKMLDARHGPVPPVVSMAAVVPESRRIARAQCPCAEGRDGRLMILPGRRESRSAVRCCGWSRAPPAPDVRSAGRGGDPIRSAPGER